MDIITLLRWGGEDFGLVVSLLGFCTGMSVLGLFVAVLLHFSLRINGNKRHITTISLISTWLSILRLHERRRSIHCGCRRCTWGYIWVFEDGERGDVITLWMWGGRGVLVFVRFRILYVDDMWRWRGGDMVVIVSLLDSVRDVATGIASTLRNNGATTTMCFTSIRSGFRNTHLSILRERRRIIHGWLLRGL
mmetsp:Transcript_18640/g.37903  ORF Transcript_18640/g.37903 Transcript_18640/m.37903 type:complete len:192 (+) Transcript_18640:70-645(+)